MPKARKNCFCRFFSCVPHRRLTDLPLSFPTCLISSLLPLCICFSVFLLNYGELWTASSVGTFFVRKVSLEPNLYCSFRDWSSNLGSSDTEHLTLRRNIFITAFTAIPECECANLFFSLTTVSPLVAIGWNRETRYRMQRWQSFIMWNSSFGISLKDITFCPGL